MGRTKTILLGLAVILFTFTIFIALPALVPSLSQLNCERVLWACGRRPIIYDTWFWPTDQPPELVVRDEARNTVIEGEGIINGLRFNGAKGTDVLKIVPRSRNR